MFTVLLSTINATFNDQSFNDMLTNDIVSFEQLGLENLPSVSLYLNKDS